ncbi:MAG: hypothetical protein ABSA93_15225 [Streptosporangiaceae bacterium]
MVTSIAISLGTSSRRSILPLTMTFGPYSLATTGGNGRVGCPGDDNLALTEQFICSVDYIPRSGITGTPRRLTPCCTTTRPLAGRGAPGSRPR